MLGEGYEETPSAAEKLEVPDWQGVSLDPLGDCLCAPRCCRSFSFRLGLLLDGLGVALVEVAGRVKFGLAREQFLQSRIVLEGPTLAVAACMEYYRPKALRNG